MPIIKESDRWTDQASVQDLDRIVIVPVEHDGVVHYVRQWWRLPFMGGGERKEAGYAWDTICRIKEWHERPPIALTYTVTCLQCIHIRDIRPQLFVLYEEWGGAR